MCGMCGMYDRYNRHGMVYIYIYGQSSGMYGILGMSESGRYCMYGWYCLCSRHGVFESISVVGPKSLVYRKDMLNTSIYSVVRVHR